jgi:hypothetical protein
MSTRLPQLALRVRIAIWTGIALLLLTPMVNWLLPGIMESGPGSRLVSLPMSQRVIGWLLVMLPYAIVALGLAQLAGFCQRIEQRQTFTSAGVSAVRRLGWSLIAAAAVLPVTRLVLRWTVLADAAPGPGLLAGISWILPVAIGAVLGAVFVTFAAVLAEAVRLAEENERFV